MSTTTFTGRYTVYDCIPGIVLYCTVKWLCRMQQIHCQERAMLCYTKKYVMQMPIPVRIPVKKEINHRMNAKQTERLIVSASDQ